jgi:hypothetical protein
MAIRINLLADAQAAEEQRRKDPVKRGAFVAAVVVSLVIFWALVLQGRIIRAHSKLSHLETKWKAIEKNYEVAVEAQRKNIEAEQRVTALHEMTTNRFLWGNVLNGLQQTLGGVEDIQVVRFKGEQSYIMNEGTPNRTNGTIVVAGKPPTATERITMTVDARDTGAPAGKRVSQFRDSLASVPFFKQTLETTNGVRLVSRSAPQADASGRQFVMFSLQGYFPEKTR